ncbi:helix-turn-helix domain-containing protein, partial [Micromonospora sp. NPDC020750]|uniref:helix-turn-helix domain-containing protein n=1 Tax=unclassified Micromonospora TaxID=2617518 RepID=UPI0037928B20
MLACADAAGESNSQIAHQLGIARHPVRKWRYRFAADRLDGLLDEPRPGWPRTMADADAELVITTTLQTTRTSTSTARPAGDGRPGRGRPGLAEPPGVGEAGRSGAPSASCSAACRWGWPPTVSRRAGRGPNALSCSAWTRSFECRRSLLYSCGRLMTLEVARDVQAFPSDQLFP